MTIFVKSSIESKLRHINVALIECSMTLGLLYFKLTATKFSRLLFPNLQSRDLDHLIQITSSGCMIL